MIKNGKDGKQSSSARAYESMFNTAKEWLAGADPAALCGRCGAAWNEEKQEIRICTLGQDVHLSWPLLAVEPAIPNWQMLVLLHYLFRCDGTRPKGTRIALADMKDGLIRGAKFDLTAERSFTRILKDRSEAEIVRAFETLGAVREAGKSDLEFRIPVFPHFPVYSSIYLADEDFPASGKLFVDTAADHSLTIEDAVTVGDLILTMIDKALLRS